MAAQVSKPSAVVRFAQVAGQTMGERGAEIAELVCVELGGSQTAEHIWAPPLLEESRWMCVRAAAMLLGRRCSLGTLDRKVTGSWSEIAKPGESASMAVDGVLAIVPKSLNARGASVGEVHQEGTLFGDASPERSSVHVVAADTCAHVPAAFLT